MAEGDPWRDKAEHGGIPRNSGLYSRQSITLSVPKLSVPKLSIPKLSVPKLSVPKLSVPKLSVPKLSVSVYVHSHRSFHIKVACTGVCAIHIEVFTFHVEVPKVVSSEVVSSVEIEVESERTDVCAVLVEVLIESTGVSAVHIEVFIHFTCKFHVEAVKAVSN
ncbi:hypothetical protein DPMN_038557, partial [Dreissena polymorpha]